ncbi:MAG: type V CRISPR-associated protein Cas12a/Cpf1 [Bacteroidetes bacterium]|nr:type V CRISPR-associated protein Cas12a/Cpf1 [Bacteroidota bacterium]MBX7239294.1 type V CRISPR-associated protein Cas12a/Cpf1 [Bacteroidia bacterium]MBS1922737.1 type V CRISPR-associated protein Cas12a/Cpf1 [Bacteroidota bacterium]HMW10325.1 type V CRISPR-associated protein Cas12a/Cpf1 [Bacteroidia bacterium]HNB12947.1 type V CRISPR-associated protein Cas12a/Cpf1 [Bacteroidia bacterium]
MQQFINKYTLSKTLRFELKPIGKTLENIQTKGLLQQDAIRAKSYQEVKKLIDRYHQYFIELALDGLKLNNLQDFQEQYLASPEEKKKEDFKKKFEKNQDDLRKEIVAAFKTGDANEIFKVLDKKELITELMVAWLTKQEDKDRIEEFKTFTTYFIGFHENRKNMYTDKAQSTAIAYRLVHENLPKFLDNIKVFEKLKAVPELHEKCSVLYKEIEEYLNIRSIDEAFELDYYNSVLTQKQIEVYNLIIGGRVAKENEKKIQGLNEYINLYNQPKDKKNKIPKLKPLYKMILSDRESVSFLAEKFENSQEVLKAIQEYYHANIKSYQSSEKDGAENVLERLQELLANLSSNNLSQIYIRNGKTITDISQALFGDFSLIKDALKYSFTNTLEIGRNGLSKKQEEVIEKYLKQDYFSITEIEVALWNYRTENDLLKDLEEEQHLIANYFNSYFKTTVNDKEYDLVANVTAKYSCIKGLLEQDYPEDKKLNQETKEIDDIKAFLDALMLVLHFVKPLMLPHDSTLEKDQSFYNTIAPYYEELQYLISLYNKVRNFASQKAYSVEKYKLNFENSTLLAGWDVNKEPDNTSVLFRKENDYFLGVMDKKHNGIFKKTPKSKTQDTYSKVNYKLLPGASKMLPKVFFSRSNIAFYNPSEEIITIRNHSTHTKGGTPQTGFEKKDFNLSDCRKMIDFFKDSIAKHPDWKQFGFNFSDTDSYDSIDGFYREVEAQGYTISYTEIDETYIHQLVDEGKLYLFQIYNKDFSEFSKGKPNMHTLYWKALFDSENLRDVVYKLNGQAEIFYRKSSIKKDKIIVHKANEKVANKNPLNTKKESLFTYDLVKDKRFTVDKFQFHVPITLNFKASGNDYINQEVLSFLRQNPDVNIIGLDRGERHLIYLSLINQKGEILQQFSLNDIINEYKGITHKTAYKTLLEKKEKERADARENWGTIESIKELKEGYISQVVHKIAKMMVEYNAIVVMEDLNMGFKRGRFAVEKQVYQKLEKMLIDKLNYLVFKDKAPNEAGGLYNALQLANKFESFQKMGKQSGFLFYVPAWNTSKIDPTTGFVNLFYTKYESIEKAQKFFEKFDSIHFNTKEQYFEFAFDYDNFTERATGTQTQWTVCTQGERILTFRNPSANNQWDNKEIKLTEQFEDLLGKHNISYGSGTCIKAQVATQSGKDFLKGMMDLFKLTLQMRNSITNSEVDYLISPVRNAQGSFYDSRNADATLPKDADANGAYHIAKKGLMWLHQIHEFEGNDWRKLDLDKTNKGWLNFVQPKNKTNE